MIGSPMILLPYDYVNLALKLETLDVLVECQMGVDPQDVGYIGTLSMLM